MSFRRLHTLQKVTILNGTHFPHLVFFLLAQFSMSYRSAHLNWTGKWALRRALGVFPLFEPIQNLTGGMQSLPRMGIQFKQVFLV
jgi:hypothetical protein